MKAIEITSANLQATLEQPGIAVLDFWAPWCGPCRAFAPVFDAAAAKHPDVRFGKVNTEQQSELAAAFGIQAIPTLAVFRDNILVFQQAGMLPASSLEQLLGKVRALDMEAVQQKVAAQNRNLAAKS